MTRPFESLPRVPVRTLAVEVVSGPDAGQSHQTKTDKLTVGTAPGNDMQLTDGAVSRFHMELSCTDAGIRVVDLTMFLPGPMLTLMMSDHGADVIRIEPPRGEPSRKPKWASDHRTSPVKARA